MTHPPSVAVIMPVRNAARFLTGAIESVLAQLPAGSEILVVDGGSEDGSQAIAGAFPGVRVLAQSGRGIAAARNQGLAAAADVIGFCDADDRWSADSLALRMARLAAQPHCDAVIGQVVLEALPGEPVTPQQASRLGRTLPGFTPGALLARRHVFEAVGLFDETLAIAADSDWFVRLVQSDLNLVLLPAVVLHKGARAAALSGDLETYRRELLRIGRRYVDRRRANAAQR
jgi:glycosyltransferase involved in cell wall biosynthesis